MLEGTEIFPEIPGSVVVQSILDKVGLTGSRVDRFEMLEKNDAILRRVVQHSSQCFMDASGPFTESLMALGKEDARRTPDGLGPDLLRLANGAAELARQHMAMREQINNVCQVHFPVVLTGPNPTDAKITLDKAIKHYEKERGKKKASPERKEAQQHILELAVMDYALQMNTVQERRDVDLTRHLIALFHTQSAYVESCRTILQVILPKMGVGMSWTGLL